jgi:hypothetical protein
MFTVTEEKKVQTTHPGQDGFYKHCQSDRAGKKQNTSWHGGTVWRASRRHCPCPAALWPIEAASLPLHATPRSSNRFFDLQPVRLDYQPPASSTFLSEQTSHQPNEQAACCALRNTPMASLIDQILLLG